MKTAIIHRRQASLSCPCATQADAEIVERRPKVALAHIWYSLSSVSLHFSLIQMRLPMESWFSRPGFLSAGLTTNHIELDGDTIQMLLIISFAVGLRCSEITGLDCGRDQTDDGRCWIEVLPGDLLVSLRSKTDWREVEIGRGSSPATCPVEALERWLKFPRISQEPLFRRATGLGKEPGPLSA
ncbi:site-specific integrase [Paenirhodobacter populi]|uniref:hypothetical protein n=1 Tax=Paenirhodobacter populi TaxID=2306993 RepID=UPI0019D499D1